MSLHEALPDQGMDHSQGILKLAIMAVGGLVLRRVIINQSTRAGEGITMMDDAEDGSSDSFRLSTFLDDDWDVGPLITGSYQDIMDSDFSEDVGDLFILKVRSEKTNTVRSIRLERSNAVGQNLKDMLVRHG